MQDAEKKSKRSSRMLRFAVSGALLVAPVAGCGGAHEEGTHVNVPPEEHVNVPPEEEEEPTVNEMPDEPSEEATSE